MNLTIYFTATLAVLFINACMVKAPTTGTELGNPTSADQISAAIKNAQSGVTQEQAYHVGDFGTMQIVDNVVQNNYVIETHEFQVTSADSKYIYYSEHIVENGSTKEYAIPKTAPKTALKLAKERGLAYSKRNTESTFSFKDILKALPLFPEKSIDKIYFALSNQAVKIKTAFKKIEVNKSSAVAEIQPIINGETHFGLHSQYQDILNKRFYKKNHSILVSAAESPTPTPSPSPTTTPVPAESAPPTSSSKYYGLNVSKQKYTTTNCSQIPGCAVNVTKIQFIEVRKLSSGNSAQLNWVYLVSNQVPGLFMILEECYATVITQNGNQYPLTECARVNGFRFGSTSIN